MQNDTLEHQFETFLFVDRKLDRSRERVIRSLEKVFFGYFRERGVIRNEPKSIPRKLINDFVTYLISRNHTKGTINQYIYLAKNYCKFVGSHELDDYKTFKETKPIVDKLSPDEIKSR